MFKRFGVAATAAVAILVLAGGSAEAAAPGVQVSVLSTFDALHAPVAAAATNIGDVAAIAGADVVQLNPNGKQKLLTSIPGGAFGIPIGLAYDRSHRLYAARPGSFGPPAQGIILKLSANGTSATPVPGSQNMVAPDGFGLDDATGDLYVTDIFGLGIWRIRNGVAQPWTTIATNPLLVLPDGVKVFNHAAYVSVEAGKILRIPILANGNAGTATVWAQLSAPGVFFDDMVLDDRNGNVYVTRLDTNELLRITPSGTITPIATNADGLLGAANMTLIHHGQQTVIYLANGASDFLGTGATTPLGPTLLRITIG